MNKSSLEAAAEAAAKVNAMLIAKGKLKLPSSQAKTKLNNLGRNMAGDLITAEIDINDAPVGARNLLTRGHIQDMICKKTGAAISTRGRYMTIAERQNISTPDCRPLYLHIQASHREAVRSAIERIQEIINQHVILSGGVKSPTVGVVTYTTPNVDSANNPSVSLSPGTFYVQDKVFVGLEHAPPTYKVREKILGPEGSFLQHIRSETGATVTLRGKGSGFIEPISGREAFEPLYIHITHPKFDRLQAAKALSINLVDTAHVEFAQWQEQQHRTVIQPITPLVIPQAAAPIAYQNQVVVTPAVIPASARAIASIPNIVTATIPMATSSVPGVSLAQNVSHLVQAPVGGVAPVAVVSSPLSVQGIPSQAVITYPTTYIANHNSVIGRAQPPPNSIIGMVPRLPVSAAYSIATSQALVTSQPGTMPVAQYAAPVQTLTYATVPTSQAVLPQQPVVVAPPNPVSYSTMPPTYVQNQQAMCPVSVAAVSPVVPMPLSQAPMPISTAYPHIQYTRAGMIEQVKRQYYEPNIAKTSIPDSRQSLQESNSNPSTENGMQPVQQPTAVGGRLTMRGSQDRDLMPPPIRPSNSGKEMSGKRGGFLSNESFEPEKKKLRGALVGLASIYGSDDSSDDESLGDQSPHSKSYAASHSNKPLM